MTDKIVTHADLPALRGIREAATSLTTYYPDDTTAKLTPLALLDRLIAAAEADQPPLPEGWYAFESVLHGTLHAYVNGGMVSASDVCGCDECHWGPVADYAHRLTPLRPTVTEADIELAARAARATYYGGVDDWDEVYEATRDDWMKTTRAALDALDIEVVTP